ncbi:MAG: AbrB/MazE/SpoVT family DNA-binding domain-containing protein [bacterium]
MPTTIQQWGNSLGIRIPSSYAKKLNIRKGSVVTISLQNNQITIKPETKNSKLLQLLEQITDDNTHNEISMGKNEGKEVW